MRKVLNFIKTYWITAVLVIALVLWYDHSSATATNAFKMFAPRVSVLGDKMISSIPKVLEGAVHSARLLIPGFFGAAFVGIVGGSIVACVPRIHETMRPLIYAFSSVPATLYVPYAIVLSATFYRASLFLVFIGCLWHFVNGTINGISTVEQRYLDSAAALDLKGAKLIFHVVLPAASPTIVNAAINALNASFVVLTVAEMFAAKSGLGYFIQYSKDMADYAGVIVGMIYLSAVIVVIRLIVDKLKKRILFWTMNKVVN